MTASDSDKMVAATLAAAKAAKAGYEKPIDYVLEYERILRILMRRTAEQRGTSQAKDDELVEVRDAAA